MATYKDGSYITTKGNNLIAKLIATGATLNFTGVTVGSGTVPEGSTPSAMEALANEVTDGSISSLENSAPGEVTLVAQVSSIGVQEAFNVSEIGLWADDPDEGRILFTYFSLAENPEPIRPDGQAVSKFATFTLVTIVSSVSLVTATIDPQAFATIKQLNDMGERVTALEEQDHVEIYGVRWLKGSSISAGERTHNAVGLTAEVGTDADTVVVNDFDKIFPFAGRRRCNGYRDADRTFHVTAYEGEPGYTINDPAKLVYVETPLFYYFDGIDGDYEVKAVSSYPVPGFLPSPAHLNPDGTLRQYSYSAAYLTAIETIGSDTLPTSRSGVHSSYNSLNGWVTNIQKLGTQYTGMLMADHYIDTLLAMVEFATKDVQTVMKGCDTLPYSAVHKALVAETAVNRILITKAQAAGYVVGQTISISATAVNLEDIARNRIITAITDKSTEETYLYFDGAAVNIATGNLVASRYWINGAADVVAASSGSPVDNTSGRYPCKYRGKENPWGFWTYIADILGSREGSEGNYTYHVNYLPDPTKYAAGALTADYVKLDYEMPGEYGYVKEFGVDERYPWVRMAKTLGASSSTFYADYYDYPSAAVCAAIVGGTFSYGLQSGPCCVYFGNAPSNSNWGRCARLS